MVQLAEAPSHRPSRDRISRFAQTIGTLVPDATSASVILLLVVAGAALALGTAPGAVVDAYYRGLWMLLPFTMQMTLILVLSAVVSGTPFFRRLVVALARKPRTLTEVIVFSVLLDAAASYFYWGLGLALGPLIAIHFAAAAEEKGIAVDFPFLLATVAAAQSVWQFGLSSSAPLLMATRGHFLESTVGVMDLRSTIWSAPAILMVITFPIAVIVVARVLMPRQVLPLSQFRDAHALATADDAPEATGDAAPTTAGFAGWIERSPLVIAILVAALLSWLYHHFVTKGNSLDLNAMNTMLLAVALVLHRSSADFSRALRGAVTVCWPVLVLYHLYGGVAGLLQFTSVGERLAGAFAAWSTPLTFTFLTAAASSIVAIFIPSSGGQWVIQGFVTSRAAAAVGTTAQHGLLAMSIGDHVGNLVSPFWPVLLAGIARVDFRTFFGYGIVFGLLWFALGVAIFTFVS
jgi:short-chain fatty acids transporter